MLDDKFVIVGTVIGSAGAVSYIWSTIKGKIKPNKVSFLLWSIAPMIAFVAQVKQGVGPEALMTFSAGFLPLLTFIASFVNKKAEWKATRFDFACGGLSLIGLILWMITRVGTIAIIFSIVADCLAAMPTLIKAYNHPETEMAWPWLATCIGIILTLATLSKLTFTNSSFIIYIFVINLMIYCCVKFKAKERIDNIRAYILE